MKLTRKRRAATPCLALKPELELKQSKPSQELDIDILARTIWGEARGETEQGMQAIACVVMNRLKKARENNGYWWGDTVRAICQKPYQFSCWNADDPNASKIRVVDEQDPILIQARHIARRYVLGFGEDITKGATHYHTKSIRPYWVKSMEETVKICNHIFYSIKG